MKMTRILSAFFALIAVCTAAAAVFLGFSRKDAVPVLLTPPAEAESQVVEMMDALCDGDFEGVSQRILGNPSLGIDREAQEDVGVLIWDRFVNSLSYEMEGTCYATDSGLAQDVKLTCLDLTSVTSRLRERSLTMLEEAVENADDLFQVYDENDNYQEEFVMGVLYDATTAVLEEDAREMTVDLTLNLSYQDGQWWVVADSALLDAISGGILY